MDLSNIALVILFVISAVCGFILLLRIPKPSKRLPPGPYPYPIIGNILQLGQNPHISLTKLAKTYGPLMRLKLGQVNLIVVSSPKFAKEILQTHDQFFPGRNSISVTHALNHHEVSIGCLPAGNQWRTLRKICKEQMFSTQRLEASRELRQVMFRKLVAYMDGCCMDGKVIDIGEAVFVTTLNLISNTLFSIDFAEYETGWGNELKGIVHGLMKVLGIMNVADYFPFLGRFDPQGVKAEAEVYFGKLLDIFDDIIDQRLQCLTEKKSDLLEALLENMKDQPGNRSELTRNDIKHLLLDLFVAGTDTTSGTVEWVMTELLRNPGIMSKARAELRDVLQLPNDHNQQQIQESDISKLPYLQALIKETFRYHPPGPFLARQVDTAAQLEIDNFAIPGNSVVLINIWATGRDPCVWSEPEIFKPERFLNGEIDLKGHNFELLPFGAGRRMCPALPLAYRMTHLLVASLIYNFDWKLEPGKTPQDVDITEKFGLSLQKAVPLKAIPFKP